MIQAIALAVLSLVFVESLGSQLYTLQLLPSERGARCLDGSPAGFYYYSGSGKNARKVMVYMNGGDFCSGYTL